jgi:hypothetical protein
MLKTWPAGKSTLVLLLGTMMLQAQNNTPYWQQHADYRMDVTMDVDTYQYSGNQTLEYTNNSPDTLNSVYYHMYFNAFQPGSEMDIRLQNIKDPDGRMFVEGKSRIAGLSPSETGFLNATALRQDGKALDYNLEGTVLEVVLAAPILPGGKSTFEMDFEGQVPVQIRRSNQ